MGIVLMRGVSYFKNALKHIENIVMFSAVIEGITSIFITSLTEVGLIFSRNDEADIINIAIIVRITQELI